MKIRTILNCALLVGLAGVAGSLVGGAIDLFVLDYRPMGHGPKHAFTAEAALAGALFGVITGFVFAFPIGAIVGGILAATGYERWLRPVAIGFGLVTLLVWLSALLFA